MTSAVVVLETSTTAELRDPAVCKIEIAAAEILRLQNSEKIPKEQQTGIESTPLNIDSKALLRHLRNSADCLLAVVELATSINEAGRKSVERRETTAQAIMPVIVKDVVTRLQKQEKAQGQRIFADFAEYNLYKIYTSKHGKNFTLPDWEKAVQTYLHPTNRLHNLPQLITYVYYSQSAQASGTYQSFFERYSTISETLGRLESGSPQHGRQLQALDTLDTEIRNYLIESEDVDPCEVQSCCEAVNLEVAVNQEITAAILDLYKNIGVILEGLIPTALAALEEPKVNIYELTVSSATQSVSNAGENTDKETQTTAVTTPTTENSAPSPSIIATAFNAQSLLQDAQKEKVLVELLKTYLDLRHALVSISAEYSKQHHDEIEFRTIQNSIKHGLQSIFPSGNTKSRELLLQLNDTKDPELQFLQAQLLTTKIPADRSMRIFVDQPEHIQLLERVVKLAVLGDTKTTTHLVEELKGSTLNSIATLCHQVKDCIVSRNVARLALIFDTEIEKYIKDGAKTAVQGAGLLLTLLAASEDPEIRKALRGRIKRIDEIPEVVNKTAEAAKSTGQFIEKLRIKITQCFEDTLSNYWGHADVVAEFRKDIEEHLLLLRFPAAYAGITTKKVFKNGHLFYGPPGAGKTYLSVCAANTYGLPYLKISREEMAKAQMKASAKNGKEDAASVEETLSKFLEEKAEEARRLQQLSGAPAAMMMIDEMEAEFLKRNPETSPRAELISTNIMLRVIEKLMAKYPEVIFVAATNHVDLVDPAAMRIGRYGFGKYLGKPDENSRQEIILGTLNELGYETHSKEILDKKEFQDIIKAADGLMPEPISLAINNMICIYRAKALERGDPIPDTKEIPFNLLVEAIELIKKQTKFQAANLEGTQSKNTAT